LDLDLDQDQDQDFDEAEFEEFSEFELREDSLDESCFGFLSHFYF